MTAGTILIVASDRLLGEAAGPWLEATGGWSVVGSVEDGVRALDALRRLRPAAVLVIGEPARTGAAALLGQIRSRFPTTTVVGLGGRSGTLSSDATGEQVAAALSLPPAAPESEPRRLPDRGLVLLGTLTTRERRILRLLAKGRTLREAGEELGVSANTVRTHMQRLYAKLGVHNRVELVRFAARQGLVDARPDQGT